MHEIMARVNLGDRPRSRIEVIKQGRTEEGIFRCSSHPSSDFTAEGTRQLQHEVNCSLVPGWVPVCPFFSIFTLCYPSRQCRELMIFHSEGESIQWPHHYNTLMQMMDCVYTSRPCCTHVTCTIMKRCSCTHAMTTNDHICSTIACCF